MAEVDIAQELERFRKRLLDLTANNRLLNYRKSRTKTLQIVNELPNEIYDRLVSRGGAFRFLAKEKDPIDGPLLGGVSSTEEQTEPDCELPEHDGEAEIEKRYRDKWLETDLESAQLERVLKSIRQHARSSIEETGVNFLYLALGLLEWIEPNSMTGDSHLAPLLLVPIRVEKTFDNRSGRYEYEISHNGEEIQDNICLQKKLELDFALQLPRFEDESTPEAYFKSVQERISHRDGWRVRREALIGFFSFRKLLMYEDLDPKKWGESLKDNPILRGVFEGCQMESGSPLFGVDYNIDENETAQEITLADDADSSQHSALCDIAEGKTLVIVGPPGTGKSQTITNAIAAAINEGKTVLFVSEKLAALDVVRQKLQRLGLGDFCLELHSEAASPKNVIKQLRTRLGKTFRKPFELQRVRSNVESRKAELFQYLKACNTTLGPLGEPLRDIFWRCVELRSRGIRPLRGVIVESDINADKYDRRKTALQELAMHAGEIGAPAKHPWRWFWCPTVRSADADEIMEAVTAMADCSRRLEAQAETLRGQMKGDLKDWVLAALRIDDESLAVLDGANQELPADLCQLLVPQDDRQVARDLIRKIKGYREPYEAMERGLSVPFEQAAVDAKALLGMKGTRVVRCGAGIGIHALPGAKSSLSCLAQAIRQLVAYAEGLETAGYGQIRTLRQFASALERYALIHHQAIKLASQLVPEHFMVQAEQSFVQAEKQHAQLAERRQNLEKVFALIDLPSTEEVDRIRKELRQYALMWLPGLRSGYRQAKRRLMVFAGPSLSRKLIPRIVRLTELGEFMRGRDAFAADGSLARSLGTMFHGMETDWDCLRDTIRWAKTAKQFGIGYKEAIRFLEKRGNSSLPGPVQVQEAVNVLKQECKDPNTQAIFADTDFLGENSDLRVWLAETERAVEDVEQLIQLSESWRHEHDDTIETLLLRAERADRLRCQKEAIEANQIAQDLLADRFAGPSTEIEPLESVVGWLDGLEALDLPGDPLGWITEGDLPAKASQLKTALTALTGTVAEWHDSRATLSDSGDCQGLTLESANANDPAARQMLEAMLDQREALVPWSNYCRAAVRADDLGLHDFTRAVTGGTLPADSAVDCYALMVNDKVAEEAVDSSATLRSFSRQGLERVRQSFRELDVRLLALNREEIAANAAEQVPPVGNSTGRVGTYTDMGLIRNEIGKEMRFCRIRCLIERAGRAMQALTPCFMMSPLSVAQFIPSNSVEFDLVLMDEASQIKPEDALGTVLRARQLVVVGDPKQLPPTSFFEKVAATDVDEDEATIADDAESILAAATSGFPNNIRCLKWHYRSRHESLIAFSNDRFYDGELVAFPSPTREGGRLGVFFHAVPGGQFTGGCNPIEASVIAHAIVRHAIDNPSETLGVGTFNIKHSTLIEDELEQICTRDPEARLAVEKLSENHEGLFIKNLENLQGDERDVIFIGYTYGPDPQSGLVANRFGPITQANGWRRLNVLITRARKRVEVFSSMTPADIHGGPDKSLGVNAMKDYLEYAQTGRLGERGSRSGREPDSPFEIAVARIVRGMGLQVVPQVGVAGYFLDLGVLKPERDDEFLLGIECDGATYHSAKSARDRDRLREEVICSRGWQIHRIWSTDWFQNQEAEERRLRERIQDLL